MAVAIEQQQQPPPQQNKKSSSLWKRFKKSVNSNNNNNTNSGTPSQKTSQQQQSKESSGIDNSQSSSSALSRPQHNTTASNNNHRRSPSNDVVADITPSGELSFFEAFNDFESSPQKNSPSQTKRTRSNYSRSSTADAGSTSEIYAVHSTSITTTPERSTPNSRPANTTYSMAASSVATPSSPKSSKGTIYSLAGGGGTVANTVAEKSIHTTKTRHSKNTCSTVSLTNDGSSTVDFSRSAAQHTQLSPVSKVTTDSDMLSPSNGGESVPHWTNFDDKQGGEDVMGKSRSEWSLQPSTHHAQSSTESKEVVRDTSTIFSSRGSSSPTDENGSEAKEVSATRYIAPPSALTTKKAVAEMMTTTVVNAAAAASTPSQPVSTSLGSSSKSNSMRKAATGKLTRKSRNRGSSLKKRSGKDLLRASSTTTENTTSVAALSAGKKVDVSKKAVTAASVPSQQRARSDTNKVDGHKITVSPTSSPPSDKNVAKKEKAPVVKSSGANPAQPHLYAELSIPIKKTRKRPSSPKSSSTSPGSNYLPRQSSTTSNGTNGEADVSLAMTSISSLTGRESLFGHAPRTQSSSMGGIWCHEEELGNGGVGGEVVNPEEEDYFDYSPNLEDNAVSGDDGMISRILKGLCHCFESIDGPTDSAGGGDATPMAAIPLTSGKSIAGEKSIGGAIDTVIETIDNTAATIANTMLSKSRSRASKAPTFSQPMMKEI